MDEIKENEYIRTKTGIIDKIIHYDNDTKLLRCKNNNFIDPFDNIAIPISTIVKHSFNIKELIEEGDIVNESLIIYRGKVASGKEKLLVGNYIINGMSLEVANIKSILTHEQYERTCYRLGDN